MLKLIKRAGLGVLRQAGVFRRVASSDWRRSRLVILCYHGVSIEDEHLWDPSLYLSLAEFEGRLDALERDGYRVLSLAEGLDRLQARNLPPKSVALTFDDGAHDFYSRAWPALQKRGYPATVYLTTYYCEDNRPVFNPASSYLLWKARGRVLDGSVAAMDDALDLRTPASRRRAWLALLAHAERERFTADDKEQVLERLAEAGAVDYRGLLRQRLLHILSPGEVRELHAAGVDIQLHTHRHRTPLERDLFLRELRDNRLSIEGMTGRRPSHFCYPSGVHRPEFLPWLCEAGVQYATTCVPGLAEANSHPLLLPRFVDHGNLSPVEFESCVSGLGLLLPTRS